MSDSIARYHLGSNSMVRVPAGLWSDDLRIPLTTSDRRLVDSQPVVTKRVFAERLKGYSKVIEKLFKCGLRARLKSKLMKKHLLRHCRAITDKMKNIRTSKSHIDHDMPVILKSE